MTTDSGRAAPMRVRRPLPELVFPQALPVSALRDEIADAIRAHPVVIVCGETGSGKTTQLPKICALAGRGQGGLIGHTQPRRLAATSVARRIAEELGSPLGTHVGFKIRFNEQIDPAATFKLMTDGVLLAETQSDPQLLAYDTIIVDEAHERSLNIDFLLGYLKQLLSGPRKGSLKLVITSATIDAERFAEHFGSTAGPAPIIQVSGRLYPVEIRYRDPVQQSDDPEDETDLPSQIENAIEELWRDRAGDVLVFLPGEREIRDVGEHLTRAWRTRGGRQGPSEILPLYSRLSAAEQDRVFSPGNGRRVVLATNVAETSLTVPGIRYVIDCGLARVKRYRYRSRVEQLQIEPISQAAANQRSGRCGRVSDGVCVRLYSEADFTGRARFTDPEVLRSSLAAVILRMKSLQLVAVEQFPFIDPPPRRAIADGFALLRELDAVDEQHELTSVGKVLARLPVDPKIGRMLLAARDQQALAELLVIAAALSTQDPRERPQSHQQASDQQHRRFVDDHSDFMGLLKLWAYWSQTNEQRSQRGESRRQSALRLEREFLSVRKFREWADVHEQLSSIVRELRWRVNATAATYEQVHLALLSGLLGNVGTRGADESQYTGTHQVKFHLHPASALVRKQPRWLLASEWVDTGRLQARVVARIEPGWIERIGSHLLLRSWSDPVWSKNAGQIVAMEKGTLYGLPIYAQRRVNFGARDPVLSRQRLIRDALVSGDIAPDPRLSFVEHNRRLIEEVERLEQKTRRPDLLVNEDFLLDWFETRVPAGIWSVPLLADWLHKGGKAASRSLHLSRDDLIRKDSVGVDSDAFPKSLTMRGAEFELSYRFDPGHVADGVTLTVPLHLLNQLDGARIEWLVPGMLKAKVTALVKSLPQKLRRHLVPLPDFVEGFCARPPMAGKGLVDALIEAVAAATSLRFQAVDFKQDQVPSHLFMNLRLVDEHGRFVGESRSLAQLRADHGQSAQSAFQQAFAAVRANVLARPDVEGIASQTGSVNGVADTVRQPGASGHTRSERHLDWQFGKLGELIELTADDGEVLIGYPALVDHKDTVSLTVFDDPHAAREVHRNGLRRLFALALREPLRHFEKNIPDFVAMSLSYARLGSAEDLREQLLLGTLDRCCMDEPWPTDADSFTARVQVARTRFGLVGMELARLVAQILGEFAGLGKRLSGLRSAPAALRDVESQLASLLDARFVTRIPVVQLPHLPRYLKAIALRVEKFRVDPERDAQRMREMAALQQGYLRLLSQRAGQTDTRLEEFGWLLQELRVSLFAQELRTPLPVSVKRLEKSWAQLLALN